MWTVCMYAKIICLHANIDVRRRAWTPPNRNPCRCEHNWHLSRQRSPLSPKQTLWTKACVYTPHKTAVDPLNTFLILYESSSSTSAYWNYNSTQNWNDPNIIFKHKSYKIWSGALIVVACTRGTDVNHNIFGSHHEFSNNIVIKCRDDVFSFSALFILIYLGPWSRFVSALR